MIGKVIKEEILKLVNNVEGYVDFLRKKNLDINYYISLKKNVLHYCDEELFEKYLKLGADPNISDILGNTMLFHAGLKASKILLKYGANPNATNILGETPLFKANLKKTKLLLDNGADINFLNNNLKNALFKSPYLKSKYLIEKGINLQQIDVLRKNALFYTEHFDKFKLLVNSGIDVNLINKNGENILFCVDYKKKKFLLENGMNPNILDEKGNSILFYSDLKTTKLFLKHGADIHTINKDFSNVLFYQGNNANVVKYLLSNTNVDFNVKNIHGENFLFNAGKDVLFYCLSVDKIKPLMYEKNNSGLNYMFVRGNDPYILYSYLKNGGDPNFLNNAQENLLFNTNDNVLFLLKQIDINWHQVNHKNENILFRINQPNIIQYALEKNIDCFIKNNEGDYCFEKDIVFKIKNFLEAKVDFSLFKHEKYNFVDYILSKKNLYTSIFENENLCVKLFIHLFEKSIYPKFFNIKEMIKVPYPKIYSIFEKEELKKETKIILLNDKKSNTLNKKRI